MWQQQRCPSCARITGYKYRKAACKLALAAPTEAPLLEIEAPPTVVVALIVRSRKRAPVVTPTCLGASPGGRRRRARWPWTGGNTHRRPGWARGAAGL